MILTALPIPLVFVVSICMGCFVKRHTFKLLDRSMIAVEKLTLPDLPPVGNYGNYGNYGNALPVFPFWNQQSRFGQMLLQPEVGQPL